MCFSQTQLESILKAKGLQISYPISCLITKHLQVIDSPITHHLTPLQLWTSSREILLLWMRETSSCSPSCNFIFALVCIYRPLLVRHPLTRSGFSVHLIRGNLCGLLLAPVRIKHCPVFPPCFTGAQTSSEGMLLLLSWAISSKNNNKKINLIKKLINKKQL